jgi:hypothetical protein
MIVPHNFTVFGFEFARMVVSCDFILDIPHTFELCFKFDLHNYALHRVPVRRRRNSRAAVPLFIVRGTEMGMNNGHQQDGITIHKKPKTFTNHSNHRRPRKKTSPAIISPVQVDTGSPERGRGRRRPAGAR